MIYLLLQVLQTMQTEEQWELKVATVQQLGSQLPFKTQKKKRKRAGSHLQAFQASGRPSNTTQLPPSSRKQHEWTHCCTFS